MMWLLQQRKVQLLQISNADIELSVPRRALDEPLRDRFARAAPDRALDELIELTLEKGAPDNVTGIAIWVSEPTLISFAGQKS